MLAMLASATVMWKEDSQQDPQLSVACVPAREQGMLSYARSWQSPGNPIGASVTIILQSKKLRSGPGVQ